MYTRFMMEFKLPSKATRSIPIKFRYTKTRYTKTSVY